MDSSDDSPLSLYDDFDFKYLARRRQSEPFALARLSESSSGITDGIQLPEDNNAFRRRGSLAVGFETDSRTSRMTSSGVSFQTLAPDSTKSGRDISILGRLLKDNSTLFRGISRRSTCPEIIIDEHANQSKETTQTSGRRLLLQVAPLATDSTQAVQTVPSPNPSSGISTSFSLTDGLVGISSKKVSLDVASLVEAPVDRSVVSSASINRGEQFIGTNHIHEQQSVLGLPQKIKVSKRELNFITPSSF